MFYSSFGIVVSQCSFDFECVLFASICVYVLSILLNVAECLQLRDDEERFVNVQLETRGRAL